MRHGSLFSGIGGFDLAAEWMGWENVFHCEWNEFNKKILKYYWPNAYSYSDITKTDFSIHRGAIDIITGGFPCQPFSSAGKRKGTEDERHLWPEMLRAIREVQPCFIVGENVGGLVNWSNGLVFEQVQADLENEGYESVAFILPACAVNAPHRRDRVWFIAHLQGMDGKQGYQKKNNRKFQRCDEYRRCFTQKWDEVAARVCIMDDGVSRGLDTKTISTEDWERSSLMSAGNAIVPQVAYEIFKAIEAFEKMMIEEQEDNRSVATKFNQGDAA